MVVATDEREAHVVGHAVSLVDLATSTHAAGGGDGAEPVDVVLKHGETTGHDHGREEVVILRDVGDGADVRVKVFGEPGLLANDLTGSLDVGARRLLLVRDAPAGRTTGTGLLGDGEGNALDEGAGNKGTLAVAGAAGHAETCGVDTRSRGLLQSIDQPVNTPSPSGKGTSRVAAAEEVVELTASARTHTGLGTEGVVAKGDGGNVAGDGDGGATDTNDGGERTAAGWLADAGAEGDALAADGHADLDVVSAHGTGDAVGGWWVDTELILLHDLADLLLAALKVGLGGDLLPAGAGERIGELGIVLGRVVGLDGAGLTLKDLVGGSGNGKGRAGHEKGGSEMDHDDNSWEETCCQEMNTKSWLPLPMASRLTTSDPYMDSATRSASPHEPHPGPVVGAKKGCGSCAWRGVICNILRTLASLRPCRLQSIMGRADIESWSTPTRIIPPIRFSDSSSVAKKTVQPCLSSLPRERTLYPTQIDGDG